MDLKRASIVILLAAGAARAGLINVGATVDGKKVDKIGTIDIFTGKDKAADNLGGKFEFAADYKYLDDWYNFRWVNTLVGATDKKTGKPVAEHPLVGKLPAIDPSPNDGKEPYYYNAKEWKDGKFGDTVIRKDNEFSLFDDSPNSGKFSDLSFETYLVVQNISDPAWKDEKQFCILSAFQWSWKIGTKNDDGDKDWDDDVSTSGGELAVNDDALKRVNLALANAGSGGDFKGWSAATGCNLTACIPAPGSIALAVLGGLLAARRRR